MLVLLYANLPDFCVASAKRRSKKEVFSPTTGCDELVVLYGKTSVFLSIFPYNRL